MAAKRGAQSNQPWIITIVVLSILIIALGVTTYMGFAGQADIGKTRDEAKRSEGIMKADRDWHRFKALLFKTYGGLGATPGDAEELNLLRSQYDSGNGKVSKDQPPSDEQAVATLIQKYDKETGWDPLKKAPKTSLQARIDSLNTELTSARKAYDKVDKDYKKKFDDLSKFLEDNRKHEAELQTALDKAQKDTEDAKKAKLDALVSAQQEITKLRDEIEETKKKNEFAKAELLANIAKLTNEKKTQESKIAVLNEKIAPPYLPDYEQPKGTVESLDREGRFAYISLGSADFVKLQLTFSIYAPSAGRTDLYGGGAQGTKAERERKRAAHEPQPKGALEVVSIMGPHSSKARITDVRDPNRDPITRGDLLFNPVWSPGERMHVAVTGLIDLSGKGEDGTMEFIHNQERQGVIIDAYLDMKDLKVKGQGITTATNYLVVGQRPELDVNLAITGSPLADRNNQIEDMMNGMRKQAKDLGVTLIPARNFMALVGYRLPKQITSFSGMHGYSAVGAPTEGEEGAEKKEGAKEKKPPKAKAPAKEKEDKAKDKEEKEDKPKDKEDKGKEKEKEAEKDKE